MEPWTPNGEDDLEPAADERHLLWVGFGGGLPAALERSLGAACRALGAAAHESIDAESAREAMERCRRADALGAILAGPLAGNAELVRLAQSLGGRRGPAPIVAVRQLPDEDEAALLIGSGCCELLPATGASADDLLRALRLAFEVARRQRAEAPWLDDSESPATWPPPALAEARRLAAVGRSFVALTHDLKNLLQPILGYAELVAGSLDDIPRAVASARELGRLAEAADALLRRRLAGAPGGSGTLRQPREADALLVGCERLLLSILGEGIRLWLAPRSPGVRVEVREGALDQILLNLAANAREAMPAGGVLEVRTRSAAGAWIVEVEDNGTGIPAAELERVFEPGRSSRRGGAGLGLWIVRGLVEELGGSVRIESRVGHGTCFTVRLPAVREPSP